MCAQSLSGRCFALVVVAIVVALLGGCQARPPAPAPPAAQAPGTRPATAAQGESLIGELVFSGEYYDAAIAIEQAAFTGPEAVEPFFDMVAIVDSALEGLEVTDEFRTSFKRGSTNGSNVKTFAKNIAVEPQGLGSYRLLHVHRRGPQHRALFRLIQNGGLNYHDLQLTKNDAGKIVATDLYVMASGEDMSTTMRQLAKLTASMDKRNAVQKFLKIDSKLPADAQAFFQLSEALAKKDFARVIALYDSLSTEIKQSKSVQIMRLVSAAQTANNEVYRAAALEFRQTFPGDPAIDLIVLSVLVTEGQLDEALATTDRLDKTLGGDPYLELFRGQAYQVVGKLAEAEQCFLRATADPAAVVDVYWQLVDLAMRNKQHDKTLKYLLAIEDRYRLDFGDLTTVPEYAEFVKAPQYQEWLQRDRKP